MRTDGWFSQAVNVRLTMAGYIHVYTVQIKTVSSIDYMRKLNTVIIVTSYIYTHVEIYRGCTKKSYILHGDRGGQWQWQRRVPWQTRHSVYTQVWRSSDIYWATSLVVCVLSFSAGDAMPVNLLDLPAIAVGGQGCLGRLAARLPLTLAGHPTVKTVI